MDPRQSGRHFGGSPVRFEQIAKTYGSFTAVHPLDLEVAAGEFIAFLGPSGSGKTTTLMMLAGFETPSKGRIFVGDREITAMPPAKRNIGMVFQNYALFPHMTVEQNIAFPLKMRGMSEADQKIAIGRVLEIVGLTKFSHRFPTQLSGGQQQRVALARAIVFEPPVLLMDEPLSALDKYLRSHLQTEIKRIQRDTGITVVYVTHDQDEAMTMSDRICVMRDGHIAQIGAPETLYNAPQDEFVAGFLGEANLLTRKLISSEAGTTRFELGGEVLALPTQRLATGAEVKVSIRPEHLKFHPEGGASAAITDVTYVGDHRRYDIRLADGTQLIAKSQIVDGAAALPVGTTVALDWPMKQMRIFAGGRALQ
jgi:spermidine/putrescine ABC transporter ATP-binding subunit